MPGIGVGVGINCLPVRQIFAGPPFSVTGTPDGAATVGTPYNSTAMVFSGGTAPYTYAVTAGALPPGLAPDATTGDPVGTPTTAGTYAGIQITGTDALGATAPSALFSIVVSASGSAAGTIGFDFSDPNQLHV